MALFILKLTVALALLGAVALAAWGRAPRRAPDPADLYRLVGGALLAYLAGMAALLDRHPLLATIAFAAGAAAASLAAWLSRGERREPPDRGDEEPQWPPPSEPDGMPGWNWERFDRERRGWERSGSARDGSDPRPTSSR